MSNREEREAEDNYEAENDASPVTGDITDNSYLRETRGVLRADDQLPVIPDQADYDDPMQPPYSNSNEQLADDEREAIDQNNILPGDRLRHAKARTQNAYNEGPDESDLPTDVREGNQGRSGTKRIT